MRVEDEKTLAALVLALGVVLAFALPDIALSLKPYLLPSLFFVMVFSLMPFARFETAQLTELHPVTLPLVVWQQFFLPGLVLAVGLMLGVERQFLYFVLVTVTSGSLFASPTLVQLMGLQQKLAVQTVILSTIAAPVSIFLSFSILHDENIRLNLAPFSERLLLYLVIPIVIFLIIRWFSRSWTETSKDRMDRVGRWGSVFSLVVFCFALEGEVAHVIQETPLLVLEYLAIAIGVAVCVAVLTRIAMYRFGIRSAMTASILASFRNVGLTFGLVGHLGGDDLAIYIGASQIPMFLSPLLFDFFFGGSSFQKHKPEEVSTVSNVDENEFSTPHDEPIAPKPRQGANRLGSWLSLPFANHKKAFSSSSELGGNEVYASLHQQTVESQEQVIVGNNIMVVQAQTQFETEEEFVSVEQKSPVTEVTSAFETDLDVGEEGARGLMAQLRDELGEESADVTSVKADPTETRRVVIYLGAIIALVIAGLSVIWGANKLFAPMLFNQDLITKVAETHIAGRNFGVFDLNINIRDLRNETIARMTKTPDAAVLGASHWQEAHVELVTGVDFYNSHVHRDYYEDMLAVTEMYVRHDRLPKELIITIRDNLLTPIPQRTDFLWLPGIKYYRAFAERIGLKPHATWETLPVNTWEELLSMPILKKHGMRHLTAPVMPHATDERHFETLDTLLPGGSILWSGEHKRLFDQKRARNEALTFAAQKRNNPPQIDPKGVQHLEALFDFLVEKGVKVTLAHPQFNPIFWEAVQGSPYIDGLKRVEDLTKSWAEKYGFAMIGGFAPESVGCTADMYIDAEHGNPKCLGMLLNQYNLLNGRPSNVNVAQ